MRTTASSASVIRVPRQAQEETRREQLAEQQAGGEHAQQRDPGSLAPAMAQQDQQHDNVGQARLDARQRGRNCRFSHRQGDGCGRIAGHAVIEIRRESG